MTLALIIVSVMVTENNYRTDNDVTFKNILN